MCQRNNYFIAEEYSVTLALHINMVFTVFALITSTVKILCTPITNTIKQAGFNTRLCLKLVDGIEIANSVDRDPTAL